MFMGGTVAINFPFFCELSEQSSKLNQYQSGNVGRTLTRQCVLFGIDTSVNCAYYE